MSKLSPNDGKNLLIDAAGISYARLPIKTHIISPGDDILEIAEKYVKPYLRKGDILFVGEKIVAISQGRAFKISEIRPSKLAKFLVKFVHKSPYGIGLGSPWTMELAIREAGAPRMLFAAALSAITKPLGWRGLFYKAVGKNINAIDGPCAYTLPPYNEYAKLGPLKPNKAARQLKEKLGCETVIIDANDLGVAALGKSSQEISDDFCKKVFRDNPLGQARQQTPFCLVRRA